MGIVLWKPLYYMSATLFVLSVVLFPISQKWSIVTALAIVTLWSRIPGLISSFFFSMSIHDLITFIIAANIGGVAGGLFAAFSLFAPRIVGPDEEPGYIVISAVSTFLAALAVPSIVAVTGGINTTSFFIYEGIVYGAYYLIIFFFQKEQIGTEMMHLPAVIFFDFVMNAFLVKLFGGTLSNMMTRGLSSGWPFLVFSGLVLGFFALAKNGDKVADAITAQWNALRGKKQETPKEISATPTQHQKEEKKKKSSRGILTGAIQKIGE